MNTQNSNNVFAFDMDNTLIMTDRANNIAYSEAISSVMGVKFDICDSERFTRNQLKTLFPELTQSKFCEIVARKEICFTSHLQETELNHNLFNKLKQLYGEGGHTILLTNSHSARAINLCNYYNLTKYFARRFFREDCLDNKYSLLKNLGYDLENVVLFENEKDSSSEAIANGIKLEKIIKIEC